MTDTTTGTALQQVDLQARLRERVREELGKLIPDDVLDQFVAQSWKELTQGITKQCRQGHPPARGYNGLPGSECEHRHTIIDAEPELLRLIKAAMRDELQKRVAAWAAEWQKGDECDALARVAFDQAAASAAVAFAEKIKADSVMTALAIFSNRIKSCSCGRQVMTGSGCACGQWVS